MTSQSSQHVDKADKGYNKALKPRHMQMIAIGGSIGTGLFLGAGGRISMGGPALAFAYALCGLFAFFMIRALGELTIYRPSSGAFVSYAREFQGEGGAYATGWLFFLDWSVTVMADITAVALYVHYWSIFTSIPQWILAFGALAIVFVLNLLSVKVFGELEFWFALIKVAAIVIFMIIAIIFIVTGNSTAGYEPGIQLIRDNGGLFPEGFAPMVTLALGVVFAFGGTEMVGVAAGEAENVRAVMPKAVNSVMWRIALFYIGSVFLLIMVMPYDAYSSNESPFVTFFSAIGVPHAGDIMNLVVLTAAMSSLNAGLYSTGRTLRSLAVAGSAPKLAAKMNKNHVPAGGIAITAGLGLVGVLINYVYPTDAFNIVMNLAGIGIAGTWMSIMVSHWIFVRRAARGEVQRPDFKLFWAPVTNFLTLAFLALIIVAMWVQDTAGKITISTFVVLAILWAIAWFAFIRKRVDGSLLEQMIPGDEDEESVESTDK
ncbi:amino acid permease [Corynebacterium pyruviciproducens]|uniref:amino acid permease n=1 Tax=Corynebacterium pyruviciproducens TaxID=598660 RepID=UPI0023F30D97|nr:amino acid permease [Corynebacterium pyruviciproducens]